jgi:hypothetical protein
MDLVTVPTVRFATLVPFFGGAPFFSVECLVVVIVVFINVIVIFVIGGRR